MFKIQHYPNHRYHKNIPVRSAFSRSEGVSDVIEKIVYWVKLGRPLVLLAGVIAYLLGLSMAYHESGIIDLSAAVLGMVIMVSAILMAHYANEFADIDTDSLTRRTWFSGGSGILPAGLVSPRLALVSAFAFLTVSVSSTAAAIFLGIVAPIVGVVVLVGIAGGWSYSMPPLRLERTWFGEIDNALLGGFLMPLIAYTCQVGSVGFDAMASCVPIFFAVLANLLGVHWADRKADEMVGKRSLVVRLGERSRRLHTISILMIYVSTVVLLGYGLPFEVAVAGLFTLPFGLWAIVAFGRGSSPLPSSATMVVLMLFTSVGWILA